MGARYLRTQRGEDAPEAIWEGESEMIWKSGNLKPLVGLSVSWVVIQGAAVAEGSEIPTGEVAVEARDGMAEDMSTHY